VNVTRDRVAKIYSDIDPVLDTWAATKALYVDREYKEEPVRSVTGVDDTGDTYQLWLDPSDDGRTIKVSPWLLDQLGMRTFHRQRKAYSYAVETNLADLKQALNEVYQKIEDWIGRFGHTRTPVGASPSRG